MKRVFVIFAMFLVLTAGYGFAQTGGMMGDQKGEIGKSQTMEQKEMMEQSKTMESMMDMTKQMSEMMGKMSGTPSKAHATSAKSGAALRIMSR